VERDLNADIYDVRTHISATKLYNQPSLVVSL
jgi:hypothetical protein